MVALRHLIQMRSVREISVCGGRRIVIFPPLCECPFATDVHRCSEEIASPPKLLNCLRGVHIANHTPKGHTAQCFNVRGPSLSFPFSCRLGKLELKIVTVSAVGIQEHLLLISG